MVGGGEVVGLKTLDRTCTLIDASPLTSRYATSSSLALIAPHCFSLSLTLVHNSLFLFVFQNMKQYSSDVFSFVKFEVLGSVAHNNISNNFLEQIPPLQISCVISENTSRTG